MTRHALKPQPTAQERIAAKRKLQETPRKDYYLVSKAKGLRYDYGQIDEDKREQVQEAALDILAHGKRAKESIIGMGQRLIDVKAILPEWTFTAWVKTEFELSDRMAQNMMNVARQYGERPEIISVLNDTVLYLLSAPSTPESARDEIEQIAITEGKSPKVARVQRVVKAHKSEPSKIDIINRDIDAYDAEAALEVAGWLAEPEPIDPTVTIRLDRAVAEQLEAAILVGALRYHVSHQAIEQLKQTLKEALR
jgi:hypothetical protein